MNQIPDMENKVEKALDSLDGIQRAQPRPYFYTRLTARIARQDKEWGGIISLISRPLFAAAMVSAVLLVNSWILFKSIDSATPAATAPPIVASDIPDEYNVAVNTFYNYETP